MWIPDIRVGRFGQIRPDVGMAFMDYPAIPYPPPMGYPVNELKYIIARKNAKIKAL